MFVHYHTNTYTDSELESDPKRAYMYVETYVKTFVYKSVCVCVLFSKDLEKELGKHRQFSKKFLADFQA